MTVTGVDRAQRRLHELGERAAHQRATLEREATSVQRSISGVPARTGRLARSVRGGSETLREVTDDSYQVGSRVPYAPFVFGGTRHMRAQPPKVPGNLAGSAARAVSNDLHHA